MTNCPSCGASVPGDARFCLECGYNISSSALQSPDTLPYTPYSSNSAATAVYPPAPVTSPVYQPRVRNIYRLLSIVLGILLIGVTVFLIIVLVRVSGQSAIKAGMTPRQTIESLNTTAKNLYDKLAANNISEGDLLTAYSTAMDVIPKEARDELIRRMRMEVDRGGGLPTIEVVSENVNGDRATVILRIRVQRPGMPPREDTSPPIPMIKEDGKWKFDLSDALRIAY